MLSRNLWVRLHSDSYGLPAYQLLSRCSKYRLLRFSPGETQSPQGRLPHSGSFCLLKSRKQDASVVCRGGGIRSYDQDDLASKGQGQGCQHDWSPL